MNEQLYEGERAVAAEVHDIDPAQHTVAVDFPFNRFDHFRTDFAPGWNDEYLRSHQPVMLVEHDRNKLIGRAITSENLGDRSRLVGKFSSFEHNPLAAQYFDHMQNGEIPGWSYNFRNAKAIKHPTERGGLRFIKADMPEFGPTVFPAIPGTAMVGLRSEEATLSVPTIAEILQLGRDGHITDAGVRSMLAEHYPNMAEHIIISTPSKPELDARTVQLVTGVRSTLVEEYGESGVRAMTIAIAEDGTVTTTEGISVPDGENVETLVRAIDDCLDDAALHIADMGERSALSEPVQKLVSLVEAAGIAVDELQPILGIADGDRADDDVDNSDWDFDASKYTPQQLKSACLVVDGDGSTKDQCHLPVRTPEGKLNKNAVHAAAGALAGARGGVKLSDGDKKSAANKLLGLYNKIGDKPPDSLMSIAGSGSRSEPTTDELSDNLRERFGL